MSTLALQRKLLYQTKLHCTTAILYVMRHGRSRSARSSVIVKSARERMRTKIVRDTRRAVVTAVTIIPPPYPGTTNPALLYSRGTAPPPCSRVCSAGAPSPGEVLCVCGVRNTGGKSTVECVQCYCLSYIQCARLTRCRAKQSRFLCHRCRPLAATKHSRTEWETPCAQTPFLYLSTAPRLLQI